MYIKASNSKKDLAEIFRFSRERWGRDQAVNYLLDLEKRFAFLGDTPGMGRARPDIAEGVFSFPHKSHVIFYRIHKDHTEIIRVLHGSRDTETAFKDIAS